MVVYQRKAFGPAPPPKVLADHATRRRSLQTTSSFTRYKNILHMADGQLFLPTLTRLNRTGTKVKCFTSGLMTNPFSEDTEPLVNFATGIVLPSDVADGLVRSMEKGREQMTTFVQKRINTNVVNFWDPVPSLQVKTFSSMTKKVNVNAADDKLITVNADRDLFGRLLIAANARRISLMEVLSYELPPVPYWLSYQDGSLRKITKSVLSSIIEKEVNVAPRLPVSPLETVYILDGTAMVQMTKSGGASTFGDLCLKYFTIFTASLSLHNCLKSHIVFDQYIETSIKAGE